jgi:hypothetical protein
MAGIGQVATKIGEGILGTPSGEQQDAEKRQQEMDKMAQEQQAKLDEQQKAIDAQRKSQQDILNAKKKRMLQASSGQSGLLNLNPTSQDSILG